VTIAVLAAQGCRSAHESSVLQRLTQVRLAQATIPRPLADLEAAVLALPRPGLTRTADLRLKTASTAPDGVHTWCLQQADLGGCYVASAEGLETRVEAAPGTVPSGTLTRQLWEVLDPAGAAVASRGVTDDELSALADDEEANFKPRWSFTAGARSGAVTSLDAPAFTFGGQVGVRYWASYFLVPGVALEIENMLQRSRSVLTLAPQARLELTMWSDENVRFFNLPTITFVMAVEPLIAFGRQPAVGARAVIGVHLGHLGRIVTPFFFEFGYQSLVVDEVGASGLRIALGLGL
jgi:hypothetical protein